MSLRETEGREGEREREVQREKESEREKHDRNQASVLNYEKIMFIHIQYMHTSCK